MILWDFKRSKKVWGILKNFNGFLGFSNNILNFKGFQVKTYKLYELCFTLLNFLNLFDFV